MNASFITSGVVTVVGAALLARHWPRRRPIVDELTDRGVRLKIGGSLHGRSDPLGRLLFTALSIIAELRADLAPGSHS